MTIAAKRFFYTTHTPYRWSSGPSLFYTDMNGDYFSTLAEAKAEALTHEVATKNDRAVDVSWGVEYSTGPIDWIGMMGFTAAEETDE